MILSGCNTKQSIAGLTARIKAKLPVSWKLIALGKIVEILKPDVICCIVYTDEIQKLPSGRVT